METRLISFPIEALVTFDVPKIQVSKAKTPQAFLDEIDERIDKEKRSKDDRMAQLGRRAGEGF